MEGDAGGGGHVVKIHCTMVFEQKCFNVFRKIYYGGGGCSDTTVSGKNVSV